jgi:toxin ParE1/3/4
MAARVDRSPDAIRDLSYIWHYIAADNPTAADHFISQIEEKFQLYATNPGMGRLRDELMPHLRSFAFGSYVVFYLPQDFGIEVLRVIHGSRDIASAFAQ